MWNTNCVPRVVLCLAAALTLPAAAQTGGTGIKIAMVAKSEANFVFQAARLGAEAAAADLAQKGTKVEIAWMTPPQEDAAAQSERIGRAVSQGASAILVACSDLKLLTQAIDAAVDKGVPVMTFDSDAPASKRFAFYGTDDGQLGEQLMADLAEMMGKKGKLAILAGNPEAPNLKAREAAVRRAAAKYPGVEVVETVHHKETPPEATASILRVNAARPDLAGWALVGGWPLFRSSLSLKLVEDLQRRGLKVVSADALPDQLAYVDKGLVGVLWAQPVYLWGKVGVETIVQKLQGKKDIPAKLRMELVRVTGANLGTWARQLQTWGFTGISEEYLKRP